MGTLGEKFIDSFWTYDDDNNAYKINVFRSIIDIGDLQDPNGTRLGRRILRTDDGLSVNVVDVDTGEFLIVQTNTIIRIK